MTAISLLSGDFEILFDDENDGGDGTTGMKMVRRAAGASTTVYTTQALYSAIADASDDFQAMGFENPMLPVTPNAFTLENNYFIDRASTEFLKEGAIDATWTVTGGQGVYRKVYTTVTAAVTTADIGDTVTEATSGDTGTLLDFEVEHDGTTVVWIRPDTSGDTFALSTALTATGGMNVLGSGAATSGRTLFSSIQAIGSVAAATEVYMYQDRFKTTDQAGAFQWWATDPALSLGIIDILIRVENASVSVAAGDVEVFARQYTTLYDNFRLRVNTGGRSALPLASAADINNTTGYRRLTAAGATGTGTFVDGEIIDEAVSGAKGVITSAGGTSGDPVLQYYLIGDVDIEFFDSGAQTVTGATSSATLTSTAPVANLLGPTDPAAGEGGTVVITLGYNEVDHDGNGTAEPYSVEVDCQSATTAVTAAKVYERIKYVTRRGAPNTDLFGGTPNIPGESYRGLEALYEWDANTGAMLEGDDINNDDGTLAAWTGRLMGYNDGTTTFATKYVTVTDQQTSIQSVVNDDVIDDVSGDDVTVHSGGTLGIQSISAVKASPFGTFTGTQIFGARGIAFTNVHADDLQNYILTSDDGVLNNPPNTVAFTVNNTLASDRVMVGREHATVADTIEKDQYGGIRTPAASYNRVSDLQISSTSATALSDDIPAAGTIRVVQTTLQEEHRYQYSSRTLGANGIWDLVDVNEGSGVTTLDTADGNGQITLTDTTATFDTAPKVEVGMLLRNTTATKLHHVWEVISVTSDTALEAVWLYGPKDATQDFDVSDTYEINKVIGDHAAAPANYSTADNIYVPYIDVESVGGTTTNSFVKSTGSNFDAVVNVRRSATSRILPFTQTATVNDAGGSSTTVRTLDTIAT